MAEQNASRPVRRSTSPRTPTTSPSTAPETSWIDDGTIIDGINARWAATHLGAAALVAFATDGMLLWLSDRVFRRVDYVRNHLTSTPDTGNTASGASRTLASSGLGQVIAGQAAGQLFGVGVSEARHPGVVDTAQHGVVYTGKENKIAEHGGADPRTGTCPFSSRAPVRPSAAVDPGRGGQSAALRVRLGH